MKRKLFAMALAGTMTVGMLAGCGSSSDSSSSSEAAASSAASSSEAAETTEAGGDYAIDVILKTTAAEYWQYVQAGANQAGEDLGVKVDVKGASSETAYDEQQNMIETDLNSGAYDAIIIAPLQADQASTLVSGTDIPVFAVDTKFEGPEVLSFIGTGNEEAAKLGGEAAVAAAKEAGWEEIKAIEISGVQGDGTNTDRLNGYMAGVNEAGGEFLEDEVQYANGVADQAVTAMEAIMQKFPEGVAIICANNDDMAVAAARTAAENEAYANTIFLGFNGDRAACEAILAGTETMSVIQDAYGMGYKAVETAVAYLNGEEVESFVDSGSGVVDIDTAQERLDLLKTYLG
ncbi:MAG: sugar ABC transporter substrate-binding protein [Lachnospiraceae bacterium]|nr:sugar ABC transporter substrate-binding protein [Lachnospiraceae bacterium]